MTLEEEALEVLRLEREWMDFDGDSEDDEEFRYAFIEAASALAQRVAGVTIEFNPQTQQVEIMPQKGN